MFHISPVFSIRYSHIDDKVLFLEQLSTVMTPGYQVLTGHKMIQKENVFDRKMPSEINLETLIFGTYCHKSDQEK